MATDPLPSLPTYLPHPNELVIERVGEALVASPLVGMRFTDDDHGVLVSSDDTNLAPYLERGLAPPTFEEAGPRTRLFVDPTTITAGIVTCGGLCPGLNDVIRSVVLALRELYDVPRVLGYRFGYAGLNPALGFEPVELTEEVVATIHQHGGTFLGSSRGPQDVGVMVDTLERDGVQALFALGGDGTMKGLAAMVDEIRRRRLPIAVIGIPKTVDNDLYWIERSFGFVTAVEEAERAVEGAHAEAWGVWKGVGLVKLMGRHSGFIAAHATLASGLVDFCLVPEVRFTLEGRGGFLDLLRQQLGEQDHAVVVVAEGAGQELVRGESSATDASGNLRLIDVGTFLRDAIVEEIDGATVKYIDPSYLIRSLPANAFDSEYCLILGQHAVHAALAGRTNMVVGYWHHHFTHVPIALTTQQRRHLNPDREVWQRVLQATGQPASMVGR